MARVNVTWGEPRRVITYPAAPENLSKLLGVGLSAAPDLSADALQDHLFAGAFSAGAEFAGGPLVTAIFNLSADLAAAADLAPDLLQSHSLVAALNAGAGAGLDLQQDHALASALSAGAGLDGNAGQTHHLGAALSATGGIAGSLELSFDLGAAFDATGAIAGDVEQTHRLGLISFGMSGNGRMDAAIEIVTAFDLSADMSGTGDLAGDINDQSTSTPIQYGFANYSGSGSAQSITGIGFEPDFILIYDRLGGGGGESWIADRGHGANHIWAASETDPINSNDDVQNDTGSVTSFDTDGFSLGSSSRGNSSGTFYSALCFKMGDQFDIITSPNYGVNGTVLAHDLSTAPVWVFSKHPTKSAGGWVDGWTLGSEATDAFGGPKQADTGAVQAATASDITIGNGGLWNPNDAETTPIYLFGDDPASGTFHSGTYTGSGGSGNAITGLGFQPSAVLIVGVDSAGIWLLHEASFTDALDLTDGIEDASYSLDSDGFTVDSGDVNQSGNTYRYFAFA